MTNTSMLDRIINMVQEEKALSKNAAFDTLSSKLPAKIVGRKPETLHLVRYLLGYKEGHVVPLVSVFGRSGTGKSTLVRYVCDYISDIKMCFANLRRAKTVFGGANIILNALDQPSLKSAQGMNVAMEKIQEAILNSIGDHKLFVLVLDEFDVLFYDKRGNPSDFVYKLVEMQSELKKKGCLSMIITISNNVLADYDLDDRVRSRIGNSEIFFQPYSQQEMLEILQQRAKDAFEKKIDENVLEHCAKLGFLEHGDARRAVDLLRVASELAMKENKEISIEHVNAASKKIQKDRIAEVIRTLSYHSKIICLVMAVKTFGLEKERHSTASLYEGYKKYLEIPPVSYRRFSELLNDLENTGLLESITGSKGRKGYSSEFRLVVMPEIVGKAIDEEWWNKHIVERKNQQDILDSATVSKSDAIYPPYKKMMKSKDQYW